MERTWEHVSAFPCSQNQQKLIPGGIFEILLQDKEKQLVLMNNHQDLNKKLHMACFGFRTHYMK